MAESLVYKIEPGAQVRLGDYPTDATGGLDKDEAEQEMPALLEELNELQYLMWGAQTHALLAVLQGLDAAGKDGVLNHVFSAIDPPGLKVASFKVPTPEERAHDFLWRIHTAAPGKGIVGVYNRSHYEEVLVVRVDRLAPPAHIEAAYGLINDYEHLLTTTGTLVVKFYLHLSKEEQKQRLLDREEEISKAWKLNPDDWATRRKWNAYIEAYETAISRCSTAHAPWYVVPADRKWAARLGIARVLVETLRTQRQGWIDKLTALQQEQLGELKKVTKE
jgi:PPK2 family polyphosphate:nucleotide phosphotransferase